MYETNQYSYELNPTMMEQLAEEFDVDKITSKFAEAVEGKSPQKAEAAGKAIFEEYGRDWIRQAIKLGEEYPDRTYEILLQAVDKTDGYLRFALVPQRFLEIAYLSTQDIATLPILENNHDRLVYGMVDCKTYKSIIEKCGEDIAKQLICKNACLTACDTLHKDLEVDALIQMTAEMPTDNRCEFTVKRT